MKVTFRKSGTVVVEDAGHMVVVGKATRDGLIAKTDFWTFTPYENREGRMKAFYGMRRKDLAPFAIATFHLIRYDGRVK